MDKKHMVAVGLVIVWFVLFLFSVDESSSFATSKWFFFFVSKVLCWLAFRELLEDFVIEYSGRIGLFLALCGLGAMLYSPNSDGVFDGGLGIGVLAEWAARKIVKVRHS
jgi:hypothetical protein